MTAGGRARLAGRRLKATNGAKTTVAQSYRLPKSVLQTAVDVDLVKGNPCRIKGAGKKGRIRCRRDCAGLRPGRRDRTALAHHDLPRCLRVPPSRGARGVAARRHRPRRGRRVDEASRTGADQRQEGRGRSNSRARGSARSTCPTRNPARKAFEVTRKAAEVRLLPMDRAGGGLVKEKMV
jgi:hypothetical protein